MVRAEPVSLKMLGLGFAEVAGPEKEFPHMESSRPPQLDLSWEPFCLTHIPFFVFTVIVFLSNGSSTYRNFSLSPKLIFTV